MHIDKCSEAQFKFGVHLGCNKTWTTGTSDYQSALETNNQLIRSFYYWGGGYGAGGGEGGVSGGAISSFDGKTTFTKKKQPFLNTLRSPKRKMVRLLLVYCSFFDSPH